MKKRDAIEMFGTVLELSKALKITRQAIYQWPDTLTTYHQDRVVGAAHRLNLLPKNSIDHSA